MKELSIEEKAQQNWIDWLETQGEHSKEFTYTYEVETGNGNIKALVTEKAQLPKFKVDDWVVWDNKISCNVDDIHQGKESLMYTITDTNNMIRSYSVKSFDNNAHLWTIQDAKYDDVLVHNDCTFIFISIKDNVVKGIYPLLDEARIWSFGNINENDDYRPATKEERDTLIKAMKAITGAGCTFNFEKKELKNIEQKPVDNIKPKFNIGNTIIKNNFGQFTITNIADGKYWYNNKIICDITEQDEWKLLIKKNNIMFKNFNVSIDESLVDEQVTTFCNIAKDMCELYAKKNHDYGNSFDEGCDKIGVSYPLGRMLDKMNRLIACMGKEETMQINETIKDTLTDLACYSVMTISYLKRKANK